MNHIFSGYVNLTATDEARADILREEISTEVRLARIAGEIQRIQKLAQSDLHQFMTLRPRLECLKGLQSTLECEVRELELLDTARDRSDFNRETVCQQHLKSLRVDREFYEEQIGPLGPVVELAGSTLPEAWEEVS